MYSILTFPYLYSPIFSKKKKKQADKQKVWIIKVYDFRHILSSCSLQKYNLIRYYKVNKILMHPSNIIFQASLSPQELVYLDYAEGVESKGMWKFQNCFMDDFHLFQWKSLSILEK